MMGFEKTHFQWKDPGGIPKEASRAMSRGLFRLLGVIVVTSALFLLFLRLRYGITVILPLAALAAIILFILAIYGIHARFPRYIVLKDTYLYRGLNDETAEEWHYKDLSRYWISSRTLDGRTYATLELETASGGKDQLLIAPGIPVDALRSFLRSKGVREGG